MLSIKMVVYLKDNFTLLWHLSGTMELRNKKKIEIKQNLNKWIKQQHQNQKKQSRLDKTPNRLSEVIIINQAFLWIYTTLVRQVLVPTGLLYSFMNDWPSDLMSLNEKARIISNQWLDIMSACSVWKNKGKEACTVKAVIFVSVICLRSSIFRRISLFFIRNFRVFFQKCTHILCNSIIVVFILVLE